MAAVIDLEKKLEPTLKGLGYDLVDVQSQNHGQLIKVFIDKTGGVNVDDCAKVSHHLSRLFAVENLAFERLEVSSPGLDRPLKKAEDFTRFVGASARIKLKNPIHGQRNFVGILRAISDGKLDLEVDGVVVSFDLDNLGQARLVPNISWRRE